MTQTEFCGLSPVLSVSYYCDSRIILLQVTHPKQAWKLYNPIAKTVQEIVITHYGIIK